MERSLLKSNQFKNPAAKRRNETVLEHNEPGGRSSQFRLAAGFFLLAFSAFLFIAFVSYLFTGKADQSVIDALHQLSLIDSGSETSNWLGLYGALVAHYFIFKWLGIAAFFLPPLLFLWGWWMLLRKELLPMGSAVIFSLFSSLWLGLLLGYIANGLPNDNGVGLLSGGLGYELARMADGLLGGGTLLLLALSMCVFIIYFFNITSLRTQTAAEAPTKPDDAPPSAVETENYDESTPGESDEIVFSITQGKKDAAQDASIGEEEGSEVARSEGIPLAIEPAHLPEKDAGEKAAQEPEFIVRPHAAKQENVAKATVQHSEYDPTLELSQFKFPPLSLLDDQDDNEVHVSRDELTQNKDKIVATLTNFKIGITSIKATIGPTVTLYEIVPEAGIKISRIKSLEDDIALNLAAFGIRIIAPIPGKGTIGIEVPNKNREMVRIRQALSVKAFTESSKELPIALGKTISNETLVVDLAKMPHLLVAGATGQGKSVGLNVILTSLLYKRHPGELKLILVDPKKVEMSLFSKLERHYLAKLPNSEEAIITDTRKVVHTLNSLCIEMESRYEILKVAGTRNMREYNAKFVARKLNPNEGHRFLPYIVLIIDELADLMMTAGKEVETPIARLAQLARAIGIHLVVATQRPSVNVITGIIKANFPARLSFRVTSKVDSRTILDSGGADQLTGHGDMLLSSGSDIVRLQCPFVSTQEVERICDFIGSQQGYASAYMLPEFEGDEESGASSVDLSDRDSFFEEAARLVVAHQQGSASLIQRKLKLGYNRAGRIIDQLEAAGIVGSFEGSKAREVLITSEESLKQLLVDLQEKHSPLH